jgi:hypothetical protein
MPEDHPTAKAERSEELAERVGFGLRPVVENKELTGFPLPPDPPEPQESRDGRTYCARAALPEEASPVPWNDRLRTEPTTDPEVQPAPTPPNSVSAGLSAMNASTRRRSPATSFVAMSPTPSRRPPGKSSRRSSPRVAYSKITRSLSAVRTSSSPVRGSLVAGRPRLRGHTLDLELRRDRPLAISGVSDPKEHPTGSVAEAVPWLWWLVMPAARSTIRRSHDYMNAGFALQLTAWNGRSAPAHSASSPIFRSRAVTCTSYARRHQPASACLDRPHILKFV